MFDAVGNVVSQGLLQVSKSESIRSAVEKAPISRDVVARFVAGARTQDAVESTRDLQGKGLTVTIDYLGEDTEDMAQATATKDAYVELLQALSQQGMTEGGRAEVSLKMTALGLALGRDGKKVALDAAREICRVAANAGTTVTLDAEHYQDIDGTLAAHAELRKDFPDVGVVVQSYLPRTEGDCRALTAEGTRVRLCKGAYRREEGVHYLDDIDVDKSFVRCLKVLMAGDGYPMVASHDPRLIDIAAALAVKNGKQAGDFEFQMLYGIRPEEQVRIADQGHTMRVYIPYGDEWYGYLVRRLAERPANLTFFLRSLATKG